MSLGQGPDETLFWSDDFDWFYLGTNDIGGLTDHFERFLADCRPDVINFHHVMGFGVQALRAARRALGDVPIVFTLHEYLMICANHGQMIKARSGALCSKASPSECGVCFPEIGPANLMRRELFIKSFLAEVDAFVSPSRFLLGRFADWGLPRAKLVMIENGLDGGEAGAAARRSRRAAGATASPSSASSTRSRASACWSTRSPASRTTSGATRSSTSTAATSSTSPRSSRPRSRSSSASPAGGCASWAPTRAPTCRR